MSPYNLTLGIHDSDTSPVSVNKGLRMKYFCRYERSIRLWLCGYDANHSFFFFLPSECVQFEIHSMLASSSGLSEEWIPWLTRKQIIMQAKAVGAKQVSLDFHFSVRTTVSLASLLSWGQKQKENLLIYNLFKFGVSTQHILMTHSKSYLNPDNSDKVDSLPSSTSWGRHSLLKGSPPL